MRFDKRIETLMAYLKALGPTGRFSQKQLIEKLGIDKSKVSRVINYLLNKKLIRLSITHAHNTKFYVFNFEKPVVEAPPQLPVSHVGDFKALLDLVASMKQRAVRDELKKQVRQREMTLTSDLIL